MSHNIYASFENRDAAERAAARLRRKGIAFRFSLQEGYSAQEPELKSAHATLSLLFPYRPPQSSNEFTGTPIHWNIRKAVLTADTLGLPLYPGGGTARAKITVDDEQLEDAKSILRNCGAYDLR